MQVSISALLALFNQINLSARRRSAACNSWNRQTDRTDPLRCGRVPSSPVSSWYFLRRFDHTAILGGGSRSKDGLDSPKTIPCQLSSKSLQSARRAFFAAFDLTEGQAGTCKWSGTKKLWHESYCLLTNRHRPFVSGYVAKACKPASKSTTAKTSSSQNWIHPKIKADFRDCYPLLVVPQFSSKAVCARSEALFRGARKS